MRARPTFGQLESADESQSSRDRTIQAAVGGTESLTEGVHVLPQCILEGAQEGESQQSFSEQNRLGVLETSSVCPTEEAPHRTVEEVSALL